MSFFSSLFLLASFSPLFASGVEVNPCDATWHYYNETGCCYKTTSDVGTWFQGTGMCEKLRLGAHLASLHSEDESKWVAMRHKNGIDGIHAWTGLSQTQTANNWTHTDGSKPWSWFHTPFFYLHNHTSCVEIIDNWLVELFQNTGKTQPTFCFHYLKSLCKYCPVPPPLPAVTTSSSSAPTVPPVSTTSGLAKAVPITTTTTVLPIHKLEKAHPRSNQLAPLPDCSSATSTTVLPPTPSTVLPPASPTPSKPTVMAKQAVSGTTTTTTTRPVSTSSTSTSTPTTPSTVKTSTTKATSSSSPATTPSAVKRAAVLGTTTVKPSSTSSTAATTPTAKTTLSSTTTSVRTPTVTPSTPHTSPSTTTVKPLPSTIAASRPTVTTTPPSTTSRIRAARQNQNNPDALTSVPTPSASTTTTNPRRQKKAEEEENKRHHSCRGEAEEMGIHNHNRNS